MSEGHKVSVAITHWNRFTLFKDCLLRVIGDPRIGEIVVSDDASTDGSWEKICAWAKEVESKTPFKLFRNDVNKDCYRNKRLAVSRTTGSGWTILFDSDNVLTPAYLDKIFAVPDWNPKVAYCPEFAEPCFDFSHLAGTTIDRKNLRKHIDDHRFRTMLNAMNYFVHSSEYLRVWDGSVNPHTADSIYQNYRWLSGGNALHVVPGLRYFHRMHATSHYKLNFRHTKGFDKEVETKLRALR